MAKLYYFYGAMGSSKSANALVVCHNYEERQMIALLCKPSIDTRDGEDVVKSRIGIERDCHTLEEVLQYTKKELRQYNAVVVDECQFATSEQIDQLASIVDDLNIPVLCYGLRTDFKGNLFEGSARLMAIADEIQEIKTMCWCGRKATFNARYNPVTKKIVRGGAQVVLGANDRYISLCRKHFNEGKLYKDEDK